MTALQILVGLLFLQHGIGVEFSLWWYLMIFAGVESARFVYNKEIK